MKLIKKKRLQSVIGLSIVDGQLRVAHAARAKNAVAILRAATAPLSLDVFHPETELVGREIRNHLEAAQIKERHCVVALSPRWLMSQHTKLPNLSPEDAASLLQIEAEKSFPCDPDELQIARSPDESNESGYVTQLAVRKDQLDRLGAVLKSAGLKPVSYTLGLDALPGAIPPAGEGRMTLVLEPKGATVLIAAGGGIAAFRTFEAAIDSEAGENVVNGAALAREVRITFEQVSPDLRQQVKQLWLLGDEAIARQLEEVLRDWSHDAGLAIERNPKARLPIAEEIVQEIATRQLKEGPPSLEFLPPKPSRWSLMMARYNSKRLATISFVVGAAAAAVGVAFAWQEYRRWSLRSEWNTMAAQVKELDAITAKIREFRPWYDLSYRNLTIIKRVVECFPENGTVSAKSFEIHNPSNVTVTGTTRDFGSLLRVQEQLQKVKEIQGLKVEQIRGKTPSQFTLTFRWNANTGT
jgi:hypothetical protein